MQNHPLARYNKTILAGLGILANLAYSYNAVHPNLYLQALLAALSVLGVYQVTNAKS